MGAWLPVVGQTCRKGSKAVGILFVSKKTASVWVPRSYPSGAGAQGRPGVCALAPGAGALSAHRVPSLHLKDILTLINPFLRFSHSREGPFTCFFFPFSLSLFLFEEKSM